MSVRLALVSIVIASLAVSLAAQTSNNSGASMSAASVSVPPVLQFSNVATDQGGTPLSGTVSITFSLYNNSQGGAALWTETQTVQLDSTGHYSVYLGITQANGIPTTLFTSGEAHWLGVKVADQAEQQPRIFLVSVPYAMKAGDAATVGGLPPSAFMMAAPASASGAVANSAGSVSFSESAPPPNGTITGSGTVDYIPLWDTTSDIISSVIFQSGSGSTAKVGINNATPATTLDVKGSGTIRGTLSALGTLSLPATGTATSGTGKDSEPMTFTASAYNSSTAVNQTFEWQAEPVNNNMSTESGTLNLLFGQGTTKPAETGLNIASNGQITFATGQTFPGTGDGTVTSVGTSTGLTGGPITGSGTLQIDPTVVPTLGAANNPFTGSISASSFTGSGSGLTNVNAATLNGFTASQFQPAGSYATLNANTFNGTQTVTGAVSATTGFQIGTNLFDYGSYSNSNAFLGFAGNSSGTGTQNMASGLAALSSVTTGGANTATGVNALLSDTTGLDNTATGDAALKKNTTGSFNTANGVFALDSNTTGSFNTALGYNAGTDSSATGLVNATAIGALADVKEGNALVLGSIKGVNTATENVNVGIGTAMPGATLDVEAPIGSTPTVNFGSLANPAALTVNGTGNFTGLVSFSSAQTFPNTISQVNQGTGITVVPNGSAVTVNNTGILTLASGVGISITTGQSPAISTSSAVPLLNGTNNFTGTNSFSQPISGNLSVTGNISALSSFQLQGANFAYGNSSNLDAYLGFAGNGTDTGFGGNTGVGAQALSYVTGSDNTALGALAASSGDGSLLSLSGNTFLGSFTGFTSPTSGLINATAVGAYAEVTQSNTMVLGAISGTNSCTGRCSSASVGIGTTTPSAPLDVEVNAAAPAIPPVLWLKNNATLSTNTPGNSVDIRFTPDGGGAVGTPNAYIRAQEDGGGGFGTSLQLGTVGDPGSGASERMRITSNGWVGIGTSAPSNILTIVQGGGEAIADGWTTYSSRRWKTNIQPLAGALGKVERLRGVSYDLKSSGKHEIGVIAEEVGRVVPEVVTYEDNGQDARGVDYSRLTALLIEAVKQQQQLIQKQQQQIAQLTSQVKTIQIKLKTKARTGSQIHTAKTEMPPVRQ
jgi:hypothetical protein